MRVLERVVVVVVALALAVGLIAVLSGYFADRDQAGITTVRHAPPSAP